MSMLPISLQSSGQPSFQPSFGPGGNIGTPPPSNTFASAVALYGNLAIYVVAALSLLVGFISLILAIIFTLTKKGGKSYWVTFTICAVLLLVCFAANIALSYFISISR